MENKDFMKMTKKELIQLIEDLKKTIQTLEEKTKNNRKGGRPKIEVSEEKKEKIQKLYFKEGWGYRKISEEIGLSHSKIRQLVLEMIELKKEEEE